jgi:hypothetical protein
MSSFSEISESGRLAGRVGGVSFMVVRATTRTGMMRRSTKSARAGGCEGAKGVGLQRKRTVRLGQERERHFDTTVVGGVYVVDEKRTKEEGDVYPREGNSWKKQKRGEA